MRVVQNVNRPNIPDSIASLGNLLRGNHQSLLNTLDGSDNMFAGVVGGNLFIGCRRMFNILERAHTVFADGTFFSLPTALNGRQVFALVILIDNHVVPALHVLMDNRSYEAYHELFVRLRRIMPQFNPRVIMSDFEAAQQLAWRSVFPDARLLGCFWHYANAIARNARRLGLHALLRDNVDARLIFRMLVALPLYPPQRMVEGFEVTEECARFIHLYDELHALFDYVRRTWLDGIGVNNLSVHLATHRTNNASESHNRTLNSRCGIHRPSVWRFLEVLQELEDIGFRDVARLRRGLRPSRSRRSSAVLNDSTITSLFRQLTDNDISCATFLRRLFYTCMNVISTSLDLHGQDEQRDASPERLPPPSLQPSSHVVGDRENHPQAISAANSAPEIMSPSTPNNGQNSRSTRFCPYRRPN